MTGTLVDDTRRHAWVTYILASIPAWTAAAIVAVMLHGMTDVPGWAAAAVVVVWIATDLAMFPRMRRYYTSEPVERRMVGEAGIAVSPLTPRGFVRVHGELWQVVLADPNATLPEGAGVCVREIRGLELIVEPATDDSDSVNCDARKPLASAAGRFRNARAESSSTRRR